jgi:hypothetical protein
MVFFPKDKLDKPLRDKVPQSPYGRLELFSLGAPPRPSLDSLRLTLQNILDRRYRERG